MVQKSYFEGVAAGRAKVDGDEDLSMEESWIGNPVRIRAWFSGEEEQKQLKVFRLSNSELFQVFSSYFLGQRSKSLDELKHWLC